MIRLAPGTPKYLLIDAREVDRNKDRRKAGTPIACVVEVVDGKSVVHRGYRLSTGTAILAYSQNVPLFRVRLAPDLPDTDIFAAHMTLAEVRLAEHHDEAIDVDEEVAQPTPDPNKGSKPK